MKTITKDISLVTIAGLAALAMLALPFTTFAAEANWELTAPSDLVFTCGGLYPHTIETIVQDEDGNISGTGSYDANNAYTWDLDGTISGDDISFSITYTGLALDTVYNLVGTIDGDGSVTGTVDNNCQTFTMPAGSLVAIEQVNDPELKDQCKKGGWEAFGFKNQGQCVRFVETGKDSR